MPARFAAMPNDAYRSRMARSCQIRASAFAPLWGVTRTYFKPAKNVTEVSERIAQPGYRIRVNDQNGDVIFVGVTTRLRAEDQDCRAA